MPKELLKVPVEFRQTPTIYIKKLLPDNFSYVGENALWNSLEIRDGEWHGQDHAIMVLGLVNHLRGSVEQRINRPIDLVVQNLNAIYHDTKRIDDGKDFGHAKRAADIIRSLTGKKPKISNETLKNAAEVCQFHNLSIDEISANPQLKDNWNLRFFLFCDVLAMVRYENGNDGFQITSELLEKILPHAFSKEEITILLNRTRLWHKTAKEFYENGIGFNKIQAMLEAGKLTNFFS